MFTNKVKCQLFVFAVFLCLTYVKIYHIASNDTDMRQNIKYTDLGETDNETDLNKGVTERNMIISQITVSKNLQQLGPCNENITFEGRKKPNLKNINMASAISRNPKTKMGGRWKPNGCIPKEKIAVIIPYRDREQHLAMVLNFVHLLLQKQNRDYRIFVVEQFTTIGENKKNKLGVDNFNKGSVMNAGYNEIRKIDNFNCFIFHDVDLIPEDDRIPYSCDSINVTHLSARVDTLQYRIVYEGLIGGVLTFPINVFNRVNGFSNRFWGYGGEDDDMWHRLSTMNISVLRPNKEIQMYTMIKHQKRKANGGNLCELVQNQKTKYKGMVNEGLHTVKYEKMFLKEYRLFTHIMVNILVPTEQVRCKYNAEKE